MRSIFWMRRDLRIHDNTALAHALIESDVVYPIYILDTKILNGARGFSGRNFFLKQSLVELRSYLTILEGNSIEVLKKFIEDNKIDRIYINKDYTPLSIARDARLEELGIEIRSFKDTVIFGDEVNRDNHPYTVFTPYKNKFLSILTPDNLKNYTAKLEYLNKIRTLESIDLQKYINNDGKEIIANSPFTPGETVALEALKHFIENGITSYNSNRDFPSISGTSRLSAHLHFGTLSIRDCFRYALNTQGKGSEVWINELIWREFYMSVIKSFPHVIHNEFQEKFQNLKWNFNEQYFKSWCDGTTGYPLIDASMRCLNKTGWMHNRLRMICASFLIKDLHIDWRIGEKYFMNHLIDMEIASNNGGWQWVASTGTDASPYFRIFSPIEQSRKFDPNNEFIKMWIPEFGTSTYPNPIIDHKIERNITLNMYNIK